MASSPTGYLLGVTADTYRLKCAVIDHFVVRHQFLTFTVADEVRKLCTAHFGLTKEDLWGTPTVTTRSLTRGVTTMMATEVSSSFWLDRVMIHAISEITTGTSVVLGDVETGSDIEAIRFNGGLVIHVGYGGYPRDRKENEIDFCCSVVDGVDTAVIRMEDHLGLPHHPFRSWTSAIRA